MKKVTIKEVRRWMKTLEENRYRKIVNADARRIAWFVNNSMSENYDDMPESMRKKWVKAEYKKERYMAKKFLESKKQNESVENKVRQIIREELNEASVDPEDAVRLLDNALEDLAYVVEKMKPQKAEKYAEKHHKSIPGLLDSLERITNFIDKLK